MSGPALQAQPFRNFPSPLLLFASCCGLSRMTFDPPIFLPIPPFVCVRRRCFWAFVTGSPSSSCCLLAPSPCDSSNCYDRSRTTNRHLFLGGRGASSSDCSSSTSITVNSSSVWLSSFWGPSSDGRSLGPGSVVRSGISSSALPVPSSPLAWPVGGVPG